MTEKSNAVAGANHDGFDWELDDGADDLILPDVVGWKLLILPFQVKTKTDGGIILPERTRDDESSLIFMGKVLQLGDLAYSRPDMGDKPWCKVGDFVVFGKYAGMRLKFKGVDLRILNDDEVLAVLPQ